jgi:phage terminase large subunit-like protein
MIKNNSSYLAFLEGLNEIDKARLLYGNWNIRPKGSSYFQREWLKKADQIPLKAYTVRAYDLAGTEPSDQNTHPDFTASIKVSKDLNGYYYISGDFHDMTKEHNLSYKGMFRKRSGERNQIMLQQAAMDGDDVHIILPQDPNSAGKAQFEDMVKFFMQHGYIVKKDPIAITKSKLQKFEIAASLISNGLVYIVESSFDKVTLEAYYKAWESFTGERSTKLYKDDATDCLSTAIAFLAKEQVIPSFTLPTLSKSNEFNF